jgi:hypothetical protein
MAKDSRKEIKVVTSPDILFDQALEILVISPKTELKKLLEEYTVEVNDHVNIYLYSENDTDIKWLLTVAKSVDYVIIDIDNCNDLTSQFLSYILSMPHTYYKCEHTKYPWDLLNMNRFYDFPNLPKENNERL